MREDMDLTKYRNRKAKLIYQVNTGGQSLAIEGIIVGGTMNEDVHLRALTSKEDSKGCAFPFKGKKIYKDFLFIKKINTTRKYSIMGHHSSNPPKKKFLFRTEKGPRKDNIIPYS